MFENVHSLNLRSELITSKRSYAVQASITHRFSTFFCSSSTFTASTSGSPSFTFDAASLSTCHSEDDLSLFPIFSKLDSVDVVDESREIRSDVWLTC